MDVNLLINWLTEGLTPEQSAVVKAAVERDSVKSKAAALRQQEEYDALQARATQLNAELEGDGPQKPGAKAYQQWVEKNRENIVKMQNDLKAYSDKYGSLEAPTQPTQPTTTTPTYSRDDVKKDAVEAVRDTFAPQWSTLMIQNGTILQKHLLAGRKTPVDFAKVAEIATSKYNGNMELAYDEYDAPEREKSVKAQQDAEVERRVKEELQKRGTSQYFPAAADTSPGGITQRTKAQISGFDKVALSQELAKAYMEAGAGENVQ